MKFETSRGVLTPCIRQRGIFSGCHSFATRAVVSQSSAKLRKFEDTLGSLFYATFREKKRRSTLTKEEKQLKEAPTYDIKKAKQPLSLHVFLF